MTWEMVLGALGIGIPATAATVGMGVKLHTRVSVLETKYEALKEIADRIEGKVDNLPEDVVDAIRDSRRK